MTSDFIALAHQHDSISDFEQAVLAALQRSVGFDAAFLHMQGQEAHLAVSGFDASVVARLKNRSLHYASELEPVKRVALASRGVAVDSEVLGEREVRCLHYFRDVAQSVSGRHSLLAYLRKGNQVFGLVMLGRSTSGFSNAELAKVEACLPTLSLARLSFAVPWVSGPLKSTGARGLLSRVALKRSRELATTATADAELVVRDRHNWREMVARTGHAELVWTRVDRRDPAESGWPYVDLFHLAAVRARARRRALFIGCGGGVSMRQFAETYPGIEIDLVEKDPAVAQLATQYFGIGEVPHLRVHTGDGIEFVRRSSPASWDVIIVDVFDAASFDQRFAQTEFLTQARAALTQGGALACNLIDVLAGGATLSGFVRAAKKVFEQVRLMPVVELDEVFSAYAQRNIVVVATRAG